MVMAIGLLREAATPTWGREIEAVREAAAGRS